MPNKAKDKVEEIKQEAKQYYRGKNMVARYVFIGFLVILLGLQFFLPKNGDNSDKKEIEKENIQNASGELVFLQKQIDTNNIYYDKAFANILSSKTQLSLLYKKSLSILPELKQNLQKEGIPIDFQYLALINHLEIPIWDISYEAIDKYGLIINSQIDQRLNTKITKNLTIKYLQDLYDLFGDWDLTLIGYFVGGDDLKQTMMNQDQKNFKNLYLDPEVLSSYYKVVAYKHVMENISDYIDIKNIQPYPELDTKTLKLGETKDLIKRANKEGYTFKEIKELNPWILGDSLPKGKWELEVYKD
ncbi:MAG TPA: hypothetical protein VJ892_00645 [Candidatus Absconditabacterales bacterium]|nr:hypothetical protein [Candidatus Absconditabacterales bacterium]